MGIKKASSTYTFNIIGYVFIFLFTIFCLLPFALLISGSLSSNDSIIKNGYHLVPQVFSTKAYELIFRFPEEILTAYGVTIFNTVVGTSIGLFITAMTGFVLQRPDCKYRNVISFLIYFTTIFQGGILPWYILITKYYHLKDSMWVLILPSLTSPFLIILMKNFIRSSVPHEIVESAKIDGAGDFRIFCSIILRIALPGLATVGLFLALGYWNDWYLSSLFISTPGKYSLQFYLYNMLNNSSYLQKMAQAGVGASIDLPSETSKLAMAVVCTGPIIFLYPFIQKYFVKGLTVGAVKG